ncbi:MAG: hypothetical protein ASARMPRED_003421 [Alectoria sarmentosa]|nr:MAG: hypothetical protein ASARMPRED_003421 [Alectoria sarmentosa]
MADHTQELTWVLQIVTARLRELGMIDSDIEDIISTIRKDVAKSINGISSSAYGRQDAEFPLVTALRQAVQNNRSIRRYLGNMKQNDEAFMGIFVQLESRIAIVSGKYCCATEMIKSIEVILVAFCSGKETVSFLMAPHVLRYQ